MGLSITEPPAQALGASESTEGTQGQVWDFLLLVKPAGDVDSCAPSAFLAPPPLPKRLRGSLTDGKHSLRLGAELLSLSQ